MKMKKVLFGLLAVLILNSIIFQSVYAALPTTPKPSNRNIHYFVGLFSYEIWRYSDGVTWTPEGYKGQRNKKMPYTYSFDIPNRKIKSVSVEWFDVSMSDPDGRDLYFRSRYQQETWDDRYRSVSNRYTPRIDGNVHGYGTDSVTFNIEVIGDLDALDPVVTTKQEQNENVMGLRYYFPILFTIELEPDVGNAIIKHYTTTGRSLNGTPGFTDREELLEKNSPYSFTHTPGNADYTYVGHKKSTVSTPSGRSITPGDPSRFTYDGSFPTYYLFFYYETDKPPTNPDPPEASCTRPSPGTKMNGRYMDPVVTAKILADLRGSERFDVLQGIPTSESLYGNILARNYLYQNTFVNMKGVCTFEVNVEKTWTVYWDPGKPGPNDPSGNPTTVPDPQQAEEKVTERYTVERPYSYWVIDNLEVYKIDQGTLRNYALPGEQITIYPQGYQPPQFTTSASGAFYPPSPPDPIVAPSGSYGGSSYKTKPSPPSENLQSVAENAVEKVEVTNDSLIFNGSTIMNSNRVPEKGPTPSSIPAPTHISDNVLYKPNNMISSDKVNRANTTSAGTIQYDLLPGNINGGSNKEFPIHAINTVTVHTPVVNYSSVTDDQAHNQKTTPNPKRSAFILDRPFTVRIPTSGQHRNIQGYGDRDYAKYVRSKQVYFPFDVYSSDRSTFYPKGTWITIPTAQLDTEFFLPVWVDEGDYQVYFRTIAENAPSDFTTQPSANLDLAHHVATDIEPVEVIGRVYDFHITDIADYNWETVFRKQKGNAAPSGASYWTGLRDIDGGARGNSLPYTLPIAPGKHPAQGYKNAVVKTGYHFKFDLKTKGNMFGVQDGISITPSFYFVSQDGSGRQPVDLYYHSGNRKFIRIGSPQDTEKRYVILNDRLRNVPQEELQDTASYLYNRGGAPGGMSAAAYMKQYLEKISKSKTWVGRLDWMLLPFEIRTLIGPKSGLPASVDTERANAAVQRWYGEYSLPADVYVVKKGTDLAAYGRTNRLDEKSPIFLKKGYIVVNFNIETIREGNTAKPHLQYIHGPLMNQWQLEGYSRTYNDPYGNRFSLMDGDVIFYHADQSSKGDFKSQVPH
ncbi:DUF5704 domain-containing protein [Paenibacillus sp. MDMC362]|uniref:DUF5704 domain-containing protein n=1 Tax=Paenibacillus sp. MDMC362 TaxID=2977365 RepID=UPI0026C829F2